MRSKTSSTVVSIQMEGTSIKPTPKDEVLIKKSVKELEKNRKECGGSIFLRHDARRHYKVLEVVCQCPVDLIEDKEDKLGEG